MNDEQTLCLAFLSYQTITPNAIVGLVEYLWPESKKSDEKLQENVRQLLNGLVSVGYVRMLSESAFALSGAGRRALLSSVDRVDGGYAVKRKAAPLLKIHKEGV